MSRARTAVLLGAVCATMTVVVYLPGAWGVPFHNASEPMEALVVREMLETGNRILPLRNQTEIPSKPPLFHWIALGFVSLFGGLDELVARLPAIFFGAATVGLVAAVGALEWGAVGGVIAALVLGTSPEWVRWSLFARTDTVFCFFLAASLLAGERWLRPGNAGWLLACAVAAGLATLAKGPAALGLVGLILGALLVQRGRWERFRPGWIVAAAILALGIPGIWYGLAWTQGGETFFQKQILAENVFRFLPSEGGPSRNHSPLAPIRYLLTGTLPWGIALGLALAVARPWRDPEVRGSSMLAFSAIWVAVVLGVCILASGKRSNYLLPAYPAVALLTAGVTARPLVESLRGMSGVRTVQISGWVAGAVTTVLAVLLGALALGFEPWQPILPFLHPRDQATIPRVAGELGSPPWWIAVAAAIFAATIITSTRRRRNRVVIGLLGGLAVVSVLAGGLVRRVEARLKTTAPFAERVAARVGPGESLWFFRETHYGLLFYLPRRIPVASRRFEQIPSDSWVLVEEKDWRDLPATVRERGHVVESSQQTAPGNPGSRYLLVRLRPPEG